MTIEARSTRADICRERRFAIAGVAQDLNRFSEQCAADAAAFVLRIDEEGPNRAVARVAGTETVDTIAVLPNPHARTRDVPTAIVARHHVGARETARPRGEADLENSVQIGLGGAANVTSVGHAAAYSRSSFDCAAALCQ